jgi:hypothetical protein
MSHKGNPPSLHQEGYFALSVNNPEGCTPCNCVPGASNVTICPADTGICPCRKNIGGRTCSQPKSGFFIPLLDFSVFEAEFTDAAAVSGLSEANILLWISLDKKQ